MSGIADFTLRFALFAALHSLLAARRLQRRMQLRFGSRFRWYRLVYNAISLVTFGWVMAAYRDAPVLYRVPGLWRLPFHLAQAAAFVALCRCAARLGIVEFIGLAQLRGETSPPLMITDGCYGRVRHPQYTLALLILLLTPVMTVKWLLLTLLAAAYFTFGAWVEERRLMKEFGSVYAAYRRQVPMFVPRLRK